MKSLIFVLLFSAQAFALFAQANRHPVIWITEEERPRILNLIEQHPWASDVVSQLHERKAVLPHTR